MKTLQEDIDDLDRMVDTGAQKDAIRSQIRLISREVAALQADYSSLAEAHAKLEEAKAKVNAEIASLKNENAPPSFRVIPDPLGPPTYEPE